MKNWKSGFTLTELMVSVAFMGISLLVSFQVYSSMVKKWDEMLRKYDAAEMENSISHSFLDSDVCSCQLSGLTIDTTGAPPPPVTLARVRSSCNFSSSNNILAEPGQSIAGAKSGIAVQSIRLEKLALMTPGTYSGQIVVSFVHISGTLAIPEARTDVAIDIEPTIGTPAARPISQCARPFDPAAPSSCPPDMVLIGPAGSLGSYCIDHDERLGGATRTMLEAEAYCSAVVYNGYTADLCTTDKYSLACRAGPGVVSDMLDDWEMVGTNGTTGVIVVGGSGCDIGAFKKPAEGAFRCCL